MTVEELCEKYALKDNEQYIRPDNKQRDMLALQLLIETMEEAGAGAKELNDVLTYSIIFIDSDKRRLNWSKAYDDLGIDNYISKYVKGE